ncbi:MAG: hypothetical protein ABIW33_04905 [Sphingomicrobium sp.]
MRRLLTSLPHAKEKQQRETFRKLEALGVAGVPAIVAQMDNRHPLVTRAISLANQSPTAFESVRYYAPELVVDAMDAILNQITGYGGSIVNGGSEQKRQAAVADWRKYAAGMRCR